MEIVSLTDGYGVGVASIATAIRCAIVECYARQRSPIAFRIPPSRLREILLLCTGDGQFVVNPHYSEIGELTLFGLPVIPPEIRFCAADLPFELWGCVVLETVQRRIEITEEELRIHGD